MTALAPLTTGDVVTYVNPVTNTPQTVVVYDARPAPAHGPDALHVIGDSLDEHGVQLRIGWQTYRPRAAFTLERRMTVDAAHHARVLANVA